MITRRRLVLSILTAFAGALGAAAAGDSKREPLEVTYYYLPG